MRFLIILFLVAGCCAEKPKYAGHDFLGAQYINSPLGEGVAPDADPIIRFDAFDCTTFVETVLANGNQKKLNQIRYKNGDIDFLNRNHFIESDWMVNNADIVKNVSGQFGETAIRNVKIDKKSWFKRVHNIDTNFKVQNIALEYLPYDNFTKPNISREMIVLFITDNQKIRDNIGTDLAVVHMGFALPNGKLRHASSDMGRVVDVDLMEYVQQRKQNKNNIGIVLVEIK